MPSICCDTTPLEDLLSRLGLLESFSAAPTLSVLHPSRNCGLQKKWKQISLNRSTLSLEIQLPVAEALK